MKKHLSITFICFLLFLSTAEAQCYQPQTIPKSIKNILKEPLHAIDLDWNGDGTKDKLLLVRNDLCTQVIIVYYNQNGEVIGSETSGDVGNGETGGFPTEMTAEKNILNLKTSEMRNEVLLKFRYDSKTKQTLLIGKEIEYYGSGASGPGHVSINYLNKKKIISTSVFDEPSGAFKPDPAPKTKSIPHGPQPLSAMNIDSMYDDAENE